ncbi:unnamed protein product [Periconia digitata]|uniref:Uncharacterized protein n=1 Tax=Periconia digitata TaxID=1303443 RepID=A0A9W4XKM2_9PLEO|nr:unnamed protein product [Periconia digitata]
MTWKSTSTSGSSASRASSLFGLDEEDKANILVYRYRSGSKSLEVTSQHDLCKTLDQDDENLPYMRVTKKHIPRGNSRLEVRTEDLLPPDDVEKFAMKPTLKSSLANVGLPSSAYWKRLLFNSYPELYIVSRSVTPSPESSRFNSPESSKNNSPESSQHVSPATTIPVDTPHPLQDPQAS